ncbi:hypothetical protein BC828DRAFT_407105 [Blastocladiella britannica]|nr:hypothetical protein BC828DRAFT_407105 [Blastocladiella britannica]
MDPSNAEQHALVDATFGDETKLDMSTLMSLRSAVADLAIQLRLKSSNDDDHGGMDEKDPLLSTSSSSRLDGESPMTSDDDDDNGGEGGRKAIGSTFMTAPPTTITPSNSMSNSTRPSIRPRSARNSLAITTPTAAAVVHEEDRSAFASVVFPGLTAERPTPLPTNLKLPIIALNVLERHLMPYPTRKRFHHYMKSHASEIMQADLWWWFFFDQFRDPTDAQATAAKDTIFTRIARKFVELLFYVVAHDDRDRFMRVCPDVYAETAYHGFVHAFEDPNSTNVITSTPGSGSSKASWGSARIASAAFQERLADRTYTWFTGIRPYERVWVKWELQAKPSRRVAITLLANHKALMQQPSQQQTGSSAHPHKRSTRSPPTGSHPVGPGKSGGGERRASDHGQRGSQQQQPEQPQMPAPLSIGTTGSADLDIPDPAWSPMHPPAPPRDSCSGGTTTCSSISSGVNGTLSSRRGGGNPGSGNGGGGGLAQVLQREQRPAHHIGPLPPVHREQFDMYQTSPLVHHYFARVMGQVPRHRRSIMHAHRPERESSAQTDRPTYRSLVDASRLRSRTAAREYRHEADVRARDRAHRGADVSGTIAAQDRAMARTLLSAVDVKEQCHALLRWDAPMRAADGLPPIPIPTATRRVGARAVAGLADLNAAGRSAEPARVYRRMRVVDVHESFQSPAVPATMHV